jgi:transposase InsO family protein
VDEAPTVAACTDRYRTGAAHAASRGIYGAPRIHVDLAVKGIRVGRKRVARLMSAAGLAGVSRRKFVTTTVKGRDRQAPDLVDRNFTAQRPNRWIADDSALTCKPTIRQKLQSTHCRQRHQPSAGSAVPLGRWETITFVAALRYNKMIAPMVVEGARAKPESG